MTSSDTVRSSPPDVIAASPVECPAGRWWICALLGLILIAGGIFVLLNVVVASLITALFFAAALVVGGLFQIVHAFYARGWGSLAISLIVGLLYVGAGLLLFTDPLATSLGLTIAIAALFFVSGVMRLWLAFRQWSDYGWILAASGIIGIAFAGVLLLGFPWSGLVVPGMLLGIDMVFHGVWWMMLGLVVRHPRTEPRMFAAT